MKAGTFVAAALLALAACDADSPPSGAGPQDGPGDPAATPAAAPGAGAGAADASTAAGGPAPGGDDAPSERIPAALQGRWGLTAADCEPGRPDAKGLLTITADRLEFYESVGTLDSIDEAEGSRLRADFDFTGEGMTWERDMVLALEDGGTTLVRREYGEEAAPGPFRYEKCE